MKRLALLMSAAAVTAVAASGAAALPLPWKKKAPAVAAQAPLVQPGPNDWVALDPENVLVIDTTKGRVIVALAPEIAPATVARIKQLTREHFYDGLKFHRVIDDFMAQTGDPKGTGEGGSTYPDVKGEFSIRRDPSTAITPVDTTSGGEEGFLGVTPVLTQPDDLAAMTNDHKVWTWPKFCPGVAGMARGNAPDSGNSQFFLMRQTTPTLEKGYAAWGTVVSGLDVVRKIKTGEPVKEPDLMTKAQILADMPADARPTVKVLDTHSKAFASIVDRAREDKGSEFSVCDVQVPSQVK